MTNSTRTGQCGSFDDDFPSTANGKTCDKLLGSVLVICTVIGVSGNATALGYFRSTKRKDLATLLYLAVSCIDICTSIAHFPVTFTLFVERQPLLFSNEAFCGTWFFVSYCLQLLSMFLVMLMTVSRTVASAFPFYEVSTKRVVGAFLLQCLVLVLLIILATVWAREFFYATDAAFCDVTMEDTGFALFISIFFTVELAIPPVVIFFSFVICLVKLSKPTPSAASQEYNRQAAVTVTMFTGIFMCCNLPHFTNILLYLIGKLIADWSCNPFHSTQFMYWYAWPVSVIVFTVLNATLNPILYYCRMSGFKEWLSRGSTAS